MTPRRATAMQVRRVRGVVVSPVEDDWVAVEEPLEIRVEGESFAVTMRTPGDDRELVAGYLFGEGVIDGLDDLVVIASVDDPRDPLGNTVDVRLTSGVPLLRRLAAKRQRFMSSACGVCGKEAIEQIFQQVKPASSGWGMAPELMHTLPGRLRQLQGGFAATGGSHAAALVTISGALEICFEDIGRHNAVDKVLGWRLLRDRVPVDDRLLLISGRAGFEIVQKAAVAQVPAVAAVGAPTTLAVELARRAGLLLIGFLRDGAYNIYAPGLGPT